jgi:hypothetical protein
LPYVVALRSLGERSSCLPEATMMAETNSVGLEPPTEDDDKGGKLRRRKQSQARSCVAFLAILSFLILVLMVKMNHTQKYISSKLRRHRAAQHDASLEVKGAGETVDSFLPPDSIYKLSLPDMAGNLVSLENYRGMVTLIVNVACL